MYNLSAQVLVVGPLCILIPTLMGKQASFVQICNFANKAGDIACVPCFEPEGGLLCS